MKNLNRIFALAIACLLALAPFGAAGAEASFTGKVVAGKTVAVSAPFGGMTGDITLRKGDRVSVGDPIATIDTTLVFAPQGGTVSGVFGQEGDSAETIGTRYGGVLYIAPVNRYTVTASTEKAYNSSENKYIGVGEKLYLSCTQDGSHTGTAVVTKVEAADASGNCAYSLEVTGGEFYMGETVGVYRSAKYEAESRVGRGNITQNAAIAVTGTGSLLKIHVKPGDVIERGEVLFETVDGVLDGLFAMDNRIVSDVSGIVASVDVSTGGTVAKGANMITVYPEDALQLEVTVSEMDLNDIAEGDKVYIEFDWDADGSQRTLGTVESISYVSGAETGSAVYSAFVSFVPTDSVRMGMSAVAYVLSMEEAAEIAAETGDVQEEPVSTPETEAADSDGDAQE